MKFSKEYFLPLLIIIFLVSCKKPNKTTYDYEASKRTIANSNSEIDIKINRFNNTLIDLKNELKLPGVSAIILKDQKVIWKSGIGYADIENRIPATPETPYQLASITKPIASVVLFQLVEKGLLDLDMLISQFKPSLDTSGKVKLLHLITHTSQGKTPGYNYSYDGNKYGTLQIPMKQLSGKSFRDLTQEKIILPLGMSSTTPNPLDPEILERFYGYSNPISNKPGVIVRKGKSYKLSDFELYDDISDRQKYGRSYWISTKLIAGALEENGIDSNNYIYNDPGWVSDKTQKEFNEFFKSTESKSLKILKNKSKPYKLNDSYQLESGKQSMFFSPGAGYISTVEDLAKLDIALDKNQLISEESKNKVFTAYRTPDGKTIPYGLGWFVQESFGTKLVWHGGEWDCASALYFKIPSVNLTLIMLTNSRKLSQAFPMGKGNVLKSGFALEFFKIFYLEDKLGEKGPDIDWKSNPKEISEKIEAIKNDSLKEFYMNQLHIIGGMYKHMGDSIIYPAMVRSLIEEGTIAVADNDITQIQSIAEIIEVGDRTDQSVEFSINENTDLGIYAIGEASQDGKMYDYGWITNKRSGDTVWKMDFISTMDGGGDITNRKVDTSINLPKGEYILQYKSDEGVSYLTWPAPPDSWFYGIKVYRNID